jgi:hypothetical protein
MASGDNLPEPVDRRPSYVSGQRIGDAERDRALTALSEHYAAGRLDRVEFDVRLDAAYQARSLDQLTVLFDDLPDPAPFRPTAAERRRTERSASRPRVAFAPLLPIVLLALAVVLVVATDGQVFILFPLMWLWFGLGRRRRFYHRG